MVVNMIPLIKKIKAGDLVFLEWEDSYGCSSKWETLAKNGKPEEMICRSVGWVTSKDKRFVVIVPHIAEIKRLGIQQGCGDMSIPLAAITRIRRILTNGTIHT
jgi:hypothetical protein